MTQVATGQGGLEPDVVDTVTVSFGSGAPVGYTHVIVFGGVNDLYSDITAKRTVAKIESDLSTMYASAREHGAKVVAAVADLRR